MDSPFLTLVVLGGVIVACFGQLPGHRPGAAVLLMASAALVFMVVLVGALRSLGQRREGRYRSLRLAQLDAMEGLVFEHYVGALLEDRGFRARVTPPSDDRGVDIVAERAGLRCAVQVKRHRGLVSRHAVSDAVAGMKHYGCNTAMVVTNSYFTSAAVALAESNQCVLVDRDLLAGWVVDFARSARPAIE